MSVACLVFFFSSRRRHTRYWRDWSSDVCSSDLVLVAVYASPVAEALAGIGTQLGYRVVVVEPDPDRRAAAVWAERRSEERRGGEGGRSRGAPYHLKKKQD